MSIASTFWFENFASIFRENQICDINGGHFYWDNLSNTQFDDNSYSQLTAPSTANDAYVGVTPYFVGIGISDRNLIPSNATINGLTLRINRSAYENFVAGSITVSDNLIQLFNNGISIGNNKSSALSWQQGSFRYDSFGGPTDTWGASLTPNIVNSSGFGISIGPEVNLDILYDYRNYTKIDNLELTVFYTVPSESGSTILPPGIPTDETISKHQLNRTIKQKFLLSEEPIKKHRVLGSNLFQAKTIQSQEELIKQSARNLNTFRPKTLEIEESISKNILKATKQITNKILESDERFSANNKFFNLFYDKLTDGNVWTATSDPGYFVWDNTYNLSDAGSNSIRRISSPQKFSATSYPLRYDISDGLYYSGYVYITGASNYAGLGFCVQNNNIDGYYVVVDTRNNNSSSSTRSFRLFKSSNSGTTIVQLATFNQTGLIEQNKWYRIIIQVDNSGNITANLYKDGGGLGIGADATLNYKDNSSPYNYGYYGLTAFSTAAFDNLTNISANFINTLVKGIRSQEEFSKPAIIPGPVSISLANKNIVEQSLLQQKLVRNFNLNNKGINSEELLSSTNNLFPGVSILRSKILISSELLSSKNDLITPDRIITKSTVDEEFLKIDRLIPGNTNINSKILQTQEQLIKQKLTAQYNISQKNLDVEENISVNILKSSNKIFNSRIISDESLSKNIVKGSAFINNLNIISTEIHGVNKFNISVKQLPLSTEELISKNTLKATGLLQNKILESQEILGKNRFGNASIIETLGFIEDKISSNILNSQYSLIQKTIYDIESYGINQFNLGIIGKSILSDELFKKQSLFNINYLTHKSPESFDSIKIEKIIPGTVNLTSKILNPEEAINTQDLFSGNFILRQKALLTEEKISFNLLFSTKNIILKPFNSEELMGQNKFNISINQNSINTDESISFNILQANKILLPKFEPDDFQYITAVILDDPETSIIYFNSRFPTLPGYSPPIVEGPIGFSGVKPVIWSIDPNGISSQEDIISNKHKVTFFASIYPLGIQSEEEIFKISIKPTQFPGKIYSWYEQIYTIESFLDFRKTS